MFATNGTALKHTLLRRVFQLDRVCNVKGMCNRYDRSILLAVRKLSACEINGSIWACNPENPCRKLYIAASVRARENQFEILCFSYIYILQFRISRRTAFIGSETRKISVPCKMDAPRKKLLSERYGRRCALYCGHRFNYGYGLSVNDSQQIVERAITSFVPVYIYAFRMPRLTCFFFFFAQWVQPFWVSAR